MAQPTTEFGNTTLANLRVIVYKKLRRDSADPVEGIDIKSVNAYIAKWDAFFKESARWNYQEYRKTKIIQHKKSDQVATGGFSFGDATFTVDDGTNLSEEGGRLTITRDEIDYESASGTTVTVSTVEDTLTPDIDHIAGEIIELLTAVPADFGKPGELWLMSSSGNSAGSKLIHRDWRTRYWPEMGTYFYKQGYIYLPAGTPSQNIQLNYWSKALKLNSDDDNLQTPEKWEDFVIMCAMAECYIALKEFGESDKLFARAGAPTENNPQPIGLLQFAIAQDAVQTDSEDEVFLPRQVVQNLTFNTLNG